MEKQERVPALGLELVLELAHGPSQFLGQEHLPPSAGTGPASPEDAPLAKVGGAGSRDPDALLLKDPQPLLVVGHKLADLAPSLEGEGRAASLEEEDEPAEAEAPSLGLVWPCAKSLY